MIYSDALRMEGTERIPLFIRDFTLGMDILGLRTTEVFSSEFNAELSSSCICAFQRFTGQDAVIGCTHSPAFIIEQFGGIMRYPDDKIPVPVSRPLSGVTDFKGLDLTFRGKMNNAFLSYHLVKEKMKGRAEVVGNVTGPLTKASVLIGAEELSMLMESDADVLNDLLAMCDEFADMIIERLSDDVDSYMIAAATDNPDMFGFERYSEFTLPHVKYVVKKMRSFGKTIAYHPHGVFISRDTDFTDSILSMDIDGFHFAENNDIHLITERFRKKMCVMGGPDVVPTLFSGTNDEVAIETQRYIDAFRGNDYIMMASCSVHRGTSLDNIRTMCETLRRQ